MRVNVSVQFYWEEDIKIESGMEEMYWIQGLKDKGEKQS